MTRLSIGIPIFNEQDVIPELISRVMSVVDRVPGGPHQVVFVDDGSSDDSRRLLTDAAARDGRIKVVCLSRNFGHQAAFCAALDHVAGDVAVLMDGDLQDDPEVILEFLRHHAAGADVVYARRVSRKEGVVLRLAYLAFYRLMAMLSEVPIPLDSGDFALLSARVVNAIRRLPEHQRYLRGLRAWVGFSQVGIDVPRHARFAGAPKYTTWNLFKLALDGISAFSVVPLRAAALCGLLAILLTTLFAIYALYVRFIGGVAPAGFTASLLITTFLAGVQLLFLGVIGEYLGRIYNEAKGRPVYVLEQVIGGD